MPPVSGSLTCEYCKDYPANPSCAEIVTTFEGPAVMSGDNLSHILG